ncbi:MAG: hypothetical protein J5826_06775, partial [Bacteroidales bacterium]|nr:hypothetical protein [Bacteroidales bacterium]
MKNKTLQEILFHVAVVALFIVASAIYFYPVMEGQELIQSDYVHSKGMAQELVEYEESTGETASWTGSMFGGMPAYQIKSPSSFNIHGLMQ